MLQPGCKVYNLGVRYLAPLALYAFGARKITSIHENARQDAEHAAKIQGWNHSACRQAAPSAPEAFAWLTEGQDGENPQKTLDE